MHQFTGGAAEWNALIARLPGSHLLQTWEWAQVKQAYGWQPMPLVWKTSGFAGPEEPLAAAMVLRRRILRQGLAAHLNILYAPKGPVLDWRDAPLRSQVLRDLARMARTQKAIFLKLDPDVVLATGMPGSQEDRADAVGQSIVSELTHSGWRSSSDQIQFRNTVLVDLTLAEEGILARMKQKTRYNVRLAQKCGVTVRPAQHGELPTLYRMYAETSARDGFVIRDERYYKEVWGTFIRAWAGRAHPCAEALLAEVAGEAVAAIVVFYFADRAYYMYGMSRQAHREKMPNHLLQWEGMRRAKARGCKVYDLWGAPDNFNESDSMWGVFRFKEGLGGEVVRTLGAWDLPTSTFWYPVYTRLVPRLLDVMRARGRHKVRQDLAAA
jgi:lipid II:glycine glycyltransferase (peptidoglycan interpeptide bridge formation enzyme)